MASRLITVEVGDFAVEALLKRRNLVLNMSQASHLLRQQLIRLLCGILNLLGQQLDRLSFPHNLGVEHHLELRGHETALGGRLVI